MHFTSIIYVSISTMLLAGCVNGQARNVLVERDSGIISIPVTENSREERANREKAAALIAAKCGKKYEITREEEVDIGFVEETFTKNAFSSSSNKTVIKRKKAEYRLWYHCL